MFLTEIKVEEVRHDGRSWSPRSMQMFGAVWFGLDQLG
jgi:hypothetical protein